MVITVCSLTASFYVYEYYRHKYNLAYLKPPVLKGIFVNGSVDVVNDSKTTNAILKIKSSNNDINIQTNIESVPMSKSGTPCYRRPDLKTMPPLEDFESYPCLSGLHPFPNVNLKREGKCVRTVCYLENSNQSAGRCNMLKTPRGKTPICTYPPQIDIHVSGSLRRSGQWEGALVNNIAQFIKSKPGTEFLDIGCNIGVYTLSVAHLGIKVTAIDPLTENLELLSESLSLGKLQKNVTLIWNAVSERHTLVNFKNDPRNIGGTRIIDASGSKSVNAKSYQASTITLDDIIPLFEGKRIAIKMDIEESEYNALLGGTKFLEEIDIAVIQMEYLFHKTGKDGVKIFKYLESKGFHPYRDLGKRGSLKAVQVVRWPNDVYYMKS